MQTSITPNYQSPPSKSLEISSGTDVMKMHTCGTVVIVLHGITCHYSILFIGLQDNNQYILLCPQHLALNV